MVSVANRSALVVFALAICHSRPESGACLGIVRPAWATRCPFVICGWKFRSPMAENHFHETTISFHPSPPRGSSRIQIRIHPSGSFRVIGFFREKIETIRARWKYSRRCEIRRENRDLFFFVDRCSFVAIVVESRDRRGKLHKIIIQSFKTIPKQISQSSHQHTPPVPASQLASPRLCRSLPL